MITIKMQANSKVTHLVFSSKDNDCIVVSNFEFDNRVQNITTNEADFDKMKRTPTVVGKWTNLKLKYELNNVDFEPVDLKDVEFKPFIISNSGTGNGVYIAPVNGSGEGVKC